MGNDQTKVAKVGDYVDVVSGAHEGRHGTINRLAQQSVGFYGEPEWFALVDIKTTGTEGQPVDDQIAVPLRRVRPR